MKAYRSCLSYFKAPWHEKQQKIVHVKKWHHLPLFSETVILTHICSLLSFCSLLKYYWTPAAKRWSNRLFTDLDNCGGTPYAAHCLCQMTSSVKIYSGAYNTVRSSAQPQHSLSHYVCINVQTMLRLFQRLWNSAAKLKFSLTSHIRRRTESALKAAQLDSHTPHIRRTTKSALKTAQLASHCRINVSCRLL